MRKNRHHHIILVTVAAVLAIVMSACGSSKKNSTTPQQTAVDKIEKEHHSSKHHDQTPAAVADALVSEARTWIGTPYKYGGHSHDGADCSGFLMEVFKAAVNVDLPRTTADQRELCQSVDRDNISVGDIIFFSSNNSGDKIAHVGMYVGDGRMIHASSSRGVVVDDLSVNYYVKHFRSIGRVPELAKANPVPRKPRPEVEVEPPAPKEETIAPAPKVEAIVTPVDTVVAPPVKVASVKETPVKETPVTPVTPKKDDPTTIVKNAFGKQKTN